MRRRAGARGRAKHEYYETEVSGLYHEIIELGLLGQFRGDRRRARVDRLHGAP